MRNNWFLVVVLLVVLVVVCSGVSRADILVTPNSQSIITPYYTQYVGSINLTNNGSVPVYNVQFTNLTFFIFPVPFNLSVNESKNVSFAIFTNELFNARSVSSKISSVFKVDFVPSPIIYEINITTSGFQPSSLTIKRNDSVKWNNLLSSDVQIRDLGSGFSQVNLPALSSQTIQYSNLKSQYSFYASPQGVTGSLIVRERENYTFSHDSLLDKQVNFVLTSTLQNSTMQVNQLTGTITTGNNQTYPEVLIELRNNDPNLVIQNINISGDKWCSNFSPNNFNLPAGGIQRVFFNVTPFVTKTNDTNKTHNVVLTITSQNAGSTVKTIPVFIQYQNMDNINVNGTNYIINVLGINETATACKQHRKGVGVYDAGFESCKDVEIIVNQTIIKEVPQNYKFSESTVAGIQDSALTFGNVSSRLENLMNRYLDFQNGVDLHVENLSSKMDRLDLFVNVTLTEQAKVIHGRNVRFWICFVLVFVVFLLWCSLWLINNVNYYNALEEARQLA